MLTQYQINGIHEIISTSDVEIDFMLIYESLRKTQADIETKISKWTLIRSQDYLMNRSLAKKAKTTKKISELKIMHKHIREQMEIIHQLIERR